MSIVGGDAIYKSHLFLKNVAVKIKTNIKQISLHMGDETNSFLLKCVSRQREMFFVCLVIPGCGHT